MGLFSSHMESLARAKESQGEPATLERWAANIHRENEAGQAAQAASRQAGAQRRQFEHQRKIQKADASFVREVTGFAIGGVPPVGHLQEIPTFIDEDLLKFSELWAAAGTPNAVFNIASSELEILTNAKVISVK